MMPNQKTLQKYIKKLQELLHIQDWEIEIQLVTSLQMIEESGNKGDMACCMRNRKRNYALISLNKEHPEIEDDWYHTLIHELFHVVTDDLYYHASCATDFIKDETTHDTITNMIDMYYERLVDKLADIYVVAYPLE